MSIRVILADDHQVFLQGLSNLLSENGVEVAAQTTNRDELPDLIARLRPQVAIVDVSMRGIPIPDLIRELRSTDAPTQVLVLTGSTPYTVADEFLAAGAKGFLLKDNAFESLLEAVQTVAAGGTYVSPEVAAELLTFRGSTSLSLLLTARQREILQLVAAGDTSKCIARKLGIHIKTVDHHRQLIREKLGARSSAEMIRLAKDGRLI